MGSANIFCFLQIQLICMGIKGKGNLQLFVLRTSGTFLAEQCNYQGCNLFRRLLSKIHGLWVQIRNQEVGFSQFFFHFKAQTSWLSNLSHQTVIVHASKIPDPLIRKSKAEIVWSFGDFFVRLKSIISI